jgi:hypothetical protein
MDDRWARLAAAFTAMPDDARQAFVDGLTMAERRLLEQALLAQAATVDPLAGVGWREWHQAVAPSYFPAEYAPHHVQFWEWIDQIGPARPDPYVALWPRGHTKSTCAEIGCVMLGARGIRSYFLYVCHTQDQADDHVGTIASILESARLAEHYPAMAEVKVGKFGESKGWRRNRLRTAAGFTVDALGLDAARRGAKLEENRPDGMVLDDIDATHASTRVVGKNIRTITQALIPALQPNKVIIGAQNLVGPNSIANQLAEGRVDMLGGAHLSGPFPAVDDMEATRRDGRWVITGGIPSWPEGMNLDRCSDQLNDMGMDAFLIECQQDVAQRPGAIWRRDEIHRWDGELPEFDRVIVAVDPNKTGRSDDAGVVVIGRAMMDDGDYHAFVLEDCSQLTEPSRWRDSLGRAAMKHKAGAVVVEHAGLGEHATLTIKGSDWWDAWPMAIYTAAADLGKKDRARPVWRLYVDNRVHHVGALPYLERQLTTWEPDVPGSVSPGALDAVVHGVTHLLIDNRGAPNVAVAS